MADLTDLAATQTVKIAGADSSGNETYFINANSAGEIKTVTTLNDNPNTPLYVQSKDQGYDPFSRLRVSNPESIIDVHFERDKQPFVFTELNTLSSTVTFDSNKRSVILACSSTLNSKAIFQSKNNYEYHAGKGQFFCASGSFVGAEANVKKRIGQFSDNNGYFFELSGSTLSVNLRSKVSGSVVDTSIAQASWNTDKLDGNGPSGLTLDISKQQIFIIDYQWLGSGRIRFGFFIEDSIVYVHHIHNANVLSVPYSQSADLPIRLECENLLGGATGSLWLTCVSLIAEGNYNPFGIIRSINNGITSRTFTNIGERKPVISIRKKSTSLDEPVKLLDFSTFVNSADDFLIELVINGTLTDASWVDADGLCQKDVSATAISGGTVVYSRYVRGDSASISSIDVDLSEYANNLSIGYDLSGNSDIISIVATTLTNNSTCMAVINYKEAL